MVEDSKLCKNTKKDLKLKIYIVGYKDEGESILVLIRDLERTVFASIIDGYKTNDLNIVKEILEQEKVEKIDVCCWTHPHKDHCNGFLDILENRIDDKTKFLLPEGMYCEDDGFFEYNDCEKEILKEFNKSLDNHRVEDRNVITVNVGEREKRPLIKYAFKLSDDETTLKISAVAPNSTVIRSSRKRGKVLPNEVSIGLIYTLDNDLNIFFGGDMENKTINLLDNEIFKNISIIKIPHHASEGASKILQLLGDKKRNDIIGCSTTFRQGRSNLPTEEMVNKYKEKIEKFLCTGKVSKDSEEHKYGVILFECDLSSKCITYKFSGEGAEL